MDSVKVLGAGERLETRDPTALYVVERGSAAVAVLRQKGQPLPLCAVSEGAAIPSLAFADASHERWQLVITPVDGPCQLRVADTSAAAQRAFLSHAGVGHFDEEGYEYALINWYIEKERRVLVEPIRLSSGSFMTHDASLAYRVLQGGVNLYVTRLLRGQQTGDKLVFVCAVPAGGVIPALCCTDGEHMRWRFVLRPAPGGAMLQPMSATDDIRRQFLIAARVKNWQDEGFDGALTEHYRANELGGRSMIELDSIERKQAGKDINSVIHSGLHGGDVAPATGASALYRVMAAACRRARMPVQPYENVKEQRADESVEALARCFGLISRRVVLEENWYRSDCGVIIGTVDEKPVAYVPRGSGYLLITADGKARRLTPALAMQADPRAVAIMRALPDGSVNAKALLGFIWRGASRWDLAWMAVLYLLCALIGVLLPKMNQLVYDEFIPLGDVDGLTGLAFVIGSFMVGNAFFSIVENLFELRLNSRIGHDVQNALFHRVFLLPQAFLRQFDSGDLTQRLAGAGGVASKVAGLITEEALEAAFALVYLIQMLRYSKSMTLAAVVMVAVFAALVLFIGRASRRHEEAAAQHSADAASRLQQYLLGIEKLRMAGAEERAVLSYAQPMARQQQSEIRANRFTGMSQVLIASSSTVFSIVLYYMIIKGDLKLSMGDFLAFNTAFGSLSAAMLGLSRALMEYWQLRPAMARIAPLLREPTEQEGAKDEVKALEGEVAVEHVTFAYTPGGADVLHDLSLHIQKGEYVGIVGPSGSGKSTLIRLLLGFEEPRSGAIRYDGRDIRTLDKHSLRRRIGTVLQDGQLISGTIFENIAISSPGATEADVWRVVEAVGLRDDLNAMPMKLNTLLSEGGGAISGGQRQRILIARALFNDPAILLFDEATSALDNLTQRQVCQTLEGMDITRIVIAHRLSTVMGCDRIVVIQDGRVAEEGSYAELMRLGGVFFHMAQRQLAGGEEVP